MSLELYNFSAAHQYADTLENTAPIFTAHNLVNAHQLINQNQWAAAQDELTLANTETDPFIQLQYLRLRAASPQTKHNLSPNSIPTPTCHKPNKPSNFGSNCTNKKA